MHLKGSFWRLPLQPVMTYSSTWWPFYFTEYTFIEHHHMKNPSWTRGQPGASPNDLNEKVLSVPHFLLDPRHLPAPTCGSKPIRPSHPSLGCSWCPGSAPGREEYVTARLPCIAQAMGWVCAMAITGQTTATHTNHNTLEKIPGTTFTKQLWFTYHYIVLHPSTTGSEWSLLWVMAWYDAKIFSCAKTRSKITL